MGFAWSGICYEDSAAALAAFVKSVPQSDGSGIVTFDTAPTISTSGLVTWTVSHRSLTTDALTVRAGTTQLPQCDLPLMDQYPVQSILFALAVFFALVLGFSAGYRR